MSEYQYKKLLRLPLAPGISAYVGSRMCTAIGIFVFFYFVAGESGSQSVYLLSSAIVAAICLGIFVPFWLILDTKVSIILPAQAIAGEKIHIGLQIAHAFLNGIFSMMFPLRLITLSLKLSNQNGQQVGILETPAIADGIDKQHLIRARTEILERGLYKVHSLTASTCFPFALCWWSTNLPINVVDSETNKNMLTVYPRSVSITGRTLQSTDIGSNNIGRINEKNRSLQESSSVRGLRPYRSGDSPRWINWKSTARSGRLIVKEFDSETEPDQSILLDTEAAWKSNDQFELAVCLANSMMLNRSSIANRRLLVPPSKFVNDVFGMSQSLERSKEILARVQIVPPASSKDHTSSEESLLTRWQILFGESLKSSPNSLMLAVIPGENSTSVSLVKITFNSPGRFSHKFGIAKNSQNIDSSDGAAASQSVNTLERSNLKTAHIQTIARVSSQSQISLL